MHVTIVIPTKEESETISDMIHSLASLQIEDASVLVIDDSEQSFTIDVALACSNFGIRVEAKVGVGNESASVKKAIEMSSDFVVVIDADGSQDVRIIPEMLRLLEENDVVIGSRYCKGGDDGASTFFSSWGNLFARTILRCKTKDLTGRFFACHRDIALENCEWKGRGEDSIEFVFNCEKKGYDICEVPFAYRQRIAGESKTNVPKYLVKYLKKVFEIRWNSFKVYSEEYIERGLNRQYIDNNPKKPGVRAKMIGNIQVPVNFCLTLWAKTPVLNLCYEFLALNFPRGIIGFLLRRFFWGSKLKRVGKDCFIDYGTTIMGAENISIGDCVHIDERCSLICVEGKIEIGNYCHIACNTVLQGKGGIEIGRHSTISSLCKIYSSSNHYKKENGELCSCSAMSPMEMQSIVKDKVQIGDFAFIGAGSSIIPGGSVGKHSVVAANSFVNLHVEDYKVVAGCPAVVKKDISFVQS